MLTAREIEDALTSGYELRGLELKGPGPRTDIHLILKVTRAALSLGNLRDGGHVVIGIDDSRPAAMLPGLQLKLRGLLFTACLSRLECYLATLVWTQLCGPGLTPP